MRCITPGIFADVVLHGRDGLRAVQLIISGLHNKEKTSGDTIAGRKHEFSSAARWASGAVTAG